MKFHYRTKIFASVIIILRSKFAENPTSNYRFKRKYADFDFTFGFQNRLFERYNKLSSNSTDFDRKSQRNQSHVQRLDTI